MVDILIGNGTLIVLGNSTDHNPTAGIAPTEPDTHQINLTSLAAGAYRQSVKIDFGATRARDWRMSAAIEPVSAPTAGDVVEFYLGFSSDSTAANGNPGNLSGSDSAWTGYGAASTDADEVAGQLDYIGQLSFGADADVHVGGVGVFTPWKRYGILVVRNGLSVALDTDAIQMSIHLSPIVDQTV